MAAWFARLPPWLLLVLFAALANWISITGWPGLAISLVLVLATTISRSLYFRRMRRILISCLPFAAYSLAIACFKLIEEILSGPWELALLLALALDVIRLPLLAALAQLILGHFSWMECQQLWRWLDRISPCWGKRFSLLCWLPGVLSRSVPVMLRGWQTAIRRPIGARRNPGFRGYLQALDTLIPWMVRELSDIASQLEHRLERDPESPVID